MRYRFAGICFFPGLRVVLFLTESKMVENAYLCGFISVFMAEIIAKKRVISVKKRVISVLISIFL